ncbi:hypothetical protein [Pseudolysinimonas sp.]|uniref:hypothetical protein n=1 Tax=Pseudolysinimonas sp. TaxID=2680009 RepID=UPI003F7DAD10
MFRKTLAAATTALVAAIFTFGAVAAPASADGVSDPAAPASTVTTDAGAAGASDPTTPAAGSTDSTPSAPPAQPSAPDAAAPAPDGSSAPTSTTPAPTAIVRSAAAPAVAPTKQCLPSSAVSYTYQGLQKINAGVVTVVNPDPTVYTDYLCQGFYVTAAGWRFLNLEGQSYMWPQGILGYNEANGGNPIVHVGTYDFGFPVTCGQGDIYASYSPIEKPSGILESPSKPYQEHFLQGMFTGPWPTSMWTGPSDSVGQYCDVLDDKKIAPEVTTQCSAPRISWTDQPGKVTYALTKGDGVTGENEVTATAGAGWVFPDNTTTHVYTFDLDDSCGVVPGDPSSTPAVCTDGVVGNGTINVDLQPGVLEYAVTYPGGTTSAVTTPTISAPVGNYTVHVSAAPGHTLQNPGRWTVIGPNSWQLAVSVLPPLDCGGQLPTDAVLPTFVKPFDATCSTGRGSIQVGPTADYLTVIDYFIDGVKVTQPTTSVSTGAHTVTAAVNQTTAPGDTLDNPGPWNVTVGADATACGQLKTLALTGTSPNGPLMAAGILLPAGAAMLLGAALIRRRREQ